MNKTAICVMLLALFLFSCGKAPQKADAIAVGDTAVEVQAEKPLKYFYRFEKEGRYIRFYADGTCHEEWGDDGRSSEYTEVDMDGRSSKDVYSLFVKATGEEFALFEGWGQVDAGVAVLNHQIVKSKYQISNFDIVSGRESATATPNKDDIQKVDDTCLIVIWPEPQHFEDEESEEAEDYFVIADDFGWYISETTGAIEEFGVNVLNVQKRYLSFAIDEMKAPWQDGLTFPKQTIILDTKTGQSQNGNSFCVFLYKKGQVPIFLSTIWSDNDVDVVKKYLGVKG